MPQRQSAMLHRRKPGIYCNQYNLLCCAVRHRDRKRVLKLLAQGIGPDQPVFHYTPALVYAAAEGHEDMVKLLLDSGATANCCTDFGYTALMAACDYGNLYMVHLLLERLLEQQAMEAACGIHIRNTDGKTALTFARERGNEEVIHLLLQAGATE